MPWYCQGIFITDKRGNCDATLHKMPARNLSLFGYWSRIEIVHFTLKNDLACSSYLCCACTHWLWFIFVFFLFSLNVIVAAICYSIDVLVLDIHNFAKTYIHTCIFTHTHGFDWLDFLACAIHERLLRSKSFYLARLFPILSLALFPSVVSSHLAFYQIRHN